MDRHLRREPTGGALIAAQSHAFEESNCVLVDPGATDTPEDVEDQPPLYASGIAWIDHAYNVIRQLRRDHGLPDIRPLTDPSSQSDSAAIVTSSEGLDPTRRQP
jgi:hypothetical protein